MQAYARQRGAQRFLTHVIMLMITIEIGRQNSGCTRRGYLMNVHTGHALMVCLPVKRRQVRRHFLNRISKSILLHEPFKFFDTVGPTYAVLVCI